MGCADEVAIGHIAAGLLDRTLPKPEWPPAAHLAAVVHLATFPTHAPLHEVGNVLDASPLGRSDWLLAHWSREQLVNVAARREWVESDLAPLPF